MRAWLVPSWWLGTVLVAATVFPACSSPTGPSSGLTHPAGTVVASAAVNARPFGVAISKNGVVYVGQQDASALTRLNLSGAVEGAVTVGNVPTDIAFSADGNTAYVTNQFSGNLGVINVGSGVQTTGVPVGGAPFRVAVERGTGLVYV